jgi:hypothetical protein
MRAPENWGAHSALDRQGVERRTNVRRRGSGRSSIRSRSPVRHGPASSAPRRTRWRNRRAGSRGVDCRSRKALVGESAPCFGGGASNGVSRESVQAVVTGFEAMDEQAINASQLTEPLPSASPDGSVAGTTSSIMTRWADQRVRGVAGVSVNQADPGVRLCVEEPDSNRHGGDGSGRHARGVVAR